MNKLKRNLFISMALICLIMIAGCSTKEKGAEPTTKSSSTVSSQEKKTDIDISLTLIKDDKELSQKTVTVPKDTNLMDALQANFDVVEDGGMITSIDGVEQSTKDNTFWTYTINDEMVNTGAKETKLTDGDKVVFTYAKF
ncbi:DUF4430 domain-containing protein [uncultured Vagococcus sp.]|uniref:DUF4430 domain-containing protein n=1 Tax=uncultured Vagococcus sp. TaxID=189676 RepID=UPI0028D80BED|nr:DUF4430 domain-containing protein [uncultured Vagococcus sp.]